ncbi:MAG: hypothetical protein K2N05_10415 [Muribaculaceae bacterium]|nr:hypothetical protein [Muribaculaceae bacterium]
MGNRKSFDHNALNRLRTEVERYVSLNLSSPADFIFLSDRLREEGHGYVSPTTLKRVWGYIADKGEDYIPSNYTLRSLCGLLGFKDWPQYCQDTASIQSAEYTGQFVETRFLPQDIEISLFWPPNRNIRLRHIKPSLFEVIENENSRLHIGDVVECGCFTQHAPAFFRVFRRNVEPLSYIAGSAQGVLFVVHSDSP